MPALVDSEFYTFTLTTKINFAITIADYVIGLFGGITLMSLWWKHRKTDNDLYSIIVISTDMLNIANLAVECVAQFLDGFNDNHLGSGENYCISFGVLAYCNCYTSLVAVTLYAYQRYRIILKKVPLTLGKCYLLLALTYAGFFLLAYSSLLLNIPFKYYPAGTYCLFDFANRSAVIAVVHSIDIAVLVGCFGTLIFVYYTIFKFVQSEFKGIMTSKGATETESLTKECLSVEKKLIFRSIIIVSTSIACYTPMLLGATYYCSTQQPVPPLYDAFSGGLCVANGLLNVIIFITTNSVYKRGFWSLFGVKLKE